MHRRPVLAALALLFAAPTGAAAQIATDTPVERAPATIPPAPAPDPDTRILVLASGGVAGVYFPLGAVLAEVWSRDIDGIEIELEATGGSVVNLNLVEEGEAHVALVQTDIASYAATAEAMFQGEAPLEGYRGMAVLYPEPVQIVTLAGAGIAAIGDLSGRRVAVGARGSGTEVNARQILEAHGLSYDDLAPAYLGFDDAARALRDDIIDAAFVTAGVPTAAVADLHATYGRPVNLVPLDPDRVAAIVERWPYYSAHAVEAGSYTGVDADVPTVAARAMLVAAADLEPEIVEAMLELLYAEPTLRRLCGTHPRGCDIARDTALEAMPIPLHPGAEAYFAR